MSVQARLERESLGLPDEKSPLAVAAGQVRAVARHGEGHDGSPSLKRGGQFAGLGVPDIDLAVARSGDPRTVRRYGYVLDQPRHAVGLGIKGCEWPAIRHAPQEDLPGSS